MPQESSLAHYIATPSSYVERPGGFLIDPSNETSKLAEFWEKNGKHITDIAKAAGLLSFAGGLLPLVAYLRNESAPLPLADASITILLYLVSVGFLFINALVVSVFLFPVYRRFIPNRYASSASDFPYAALPRIASMGRQYGREFGYIPIFICALIVSGIDRWVALGVFLSGECLWFAFTLLPTLRTARKEKGRMAEIVTNLMVDSFSSLLFFFLMFIFIAGLGRRWFTSGHHGNLLSLAVVIITALIHAFVGILVRTWREALVIYFVGNVLLVMMWPGAAYLGGSTLGLLGIGGNIPVSLTVKTYGRTGTVSGTEAVEGCLVIMTGADVIIRPTDHLADCALHAQSTWVSADDPPIVFYKDVERYPRADVIRISRFPRRCGTVDGLPDPSCASPQKPAGSQTSSTD